MLDGSTPFVGVCAPVYNEASNIRHTIDEWVGLLRSQGYLFEIVLCDDASTDDTAAALSGLDPQSGVRTVRHAVNQGAGAALRTAIASSRAEWLVLIDSDGQFSLADGLRMLAQARETGALAAIGVRKKKDRLLLVLGSRLTSWMGNVIYRSRLRDFNCALKIVRGEECRSMQLRTTRFNYSTEMTSRILLMGLSLVEVPIGHAERQAGQSSARVFRDGWGRIKYLGYLWAEARLVRAGIMDLGRGAE